MKKFILLFIVFYAYQSNAQCEFDLEQILKNGVSDSSSFDTFALNNGYTYNAEEKTYFCIPDKNNPFEENLFGRSLDNASLIINHTTYSKASYLNFKNSLKTMGFKYNGVQHKENMTYFEYSVNNIYVFLATMTSNAQTIYILVIKIDLSN